MRSRPPASIRSRTANCAEEAVPESPRTPTTKGAVGSSVSKQGAAGRKDAPGPPPALCHHARVPSTTTSTTTTTTTSSSTMTPTTLTEPPTTTTEPSTTTTTLPPSGPLIAITAPVDGAVFLVGQTVGL